MMGFTNSHPTVEVAPCASVLLKSKTMISQYTTPVCTFGNVTLGTYIFSWSNEVKPKSISQFSAKYRTPTYSGVARKVLWAVAVIQLKKIDSC